MRRSSRRTSPISASPSTSVSSTSATWLADQADGNFDAYLWSWIGNLDPGDFYYAQHHSSGGFNAQGYSNPDVDALLDARLPQRPISTARKALYDDAAKLIVDDASYVYLYNPDDRPRLVSPDVEGYTVRGDRGHPLPGRQPDPVVAGGPGAQMLRYLLRRAVQALVVLVGAAVLVFALLQIVPGDPIRSAMGTRFDPEIVRRRSRQRPDSICRCTSSCSATSATPLSATSASASAWRERLRAR